ncbi:PGF-pre-PGF domain-containing protein [Methanococcoides seepicolus]|uniref:PGF-pre-PGF domain-containing protein n=1 Tax=Methanococcoides seepicolus TaxID=2828780 RepID=A0A9E5DAI6_9EURY|nr:PGF-pre-PGF domain-containing protein [Methanococcoides seepicolus]MCM1986141.1 PGF-pre-PGF domain-containing protein [Methanococcoides seepicolus]
MQSIRIITITILLFCIANVALAAPAGNDSPAINETTFPAVNMAPLNPEFIDYMEKLEENVDKDTHIQSSSLNTDESIRERYSINGIIPSPVDNSHIDKSYTSSVNDIYLFSASEETLPAYYDLRNESRVTPVRDQGHSGSCWAHAVYASLESCMILDDGFYDFSENHMKNLLSNNYPEGFDRNSNGGGTSGMALAYLARWTGPVNESDEPYNDTSIYSNTSIPERKHVQEVLYLPFREYNNSHDDDFLKSAVMDYGAVFSYFYVNWAGFDDKRLTYYFDGTDYIGGHAVALVGWNDSYPKENFNITPPDDGAFICKNSWNTTVGDDGYFYISYYEASFNDNTGQVAVFIGTEDVDNYDNIYQYDPLGHIRNIGYENATINVSWAANIFTAGSDEYLNAVSFYTPDEMTDYELYIHKNPDQGPINSSGYVYSTSDTFEYAGYHTIDLNHPVKLEQDQNFSIVIKFIDPDYAELVAIEKPIENYSSKATANPGEGYISSNGTSWTDITLDYENTSICIKAFTDDPQVTSIILDPVNATIYEGETLQFNDEILDQYNYSIDANVVWSSQNQTVGTINAISGLFTAHTTGNTTISVTNGSVANSTTVNVLDIPVFSLTMDEPREGYNYSTGSIFLNVSANLDVDTWMYNINATGNHTFSPNATLSLPDGEHHLTVFANDTIGNMASVMVNFSIDTIVPTVTIELPQNTTYATNTVNLNVSADEGVAIWMYNVNGTGNHTFTPNITISLPDGDHNVTVFANDTVGNVGISMVNFTIDTTAPTVTIELPQNTTYATNTVNLNVSADEDVINWMYNVNATGNHTFTPNITLTLPEGKHNVTVFAKDTVGNVGSSMINFTIDIPLPSTPRKTSSSSSGGGGSGNTGEAFENIALKEVKTIFINKDSEVTYYFEEEEDKIEYIGFYSLKNSGRISATIEVLNGKSTLVTDTPPGTVYQHMNIWVGQAGFATENNIADPVIGFKVSKSWIAENDIDETTITLCRNHGDKWTQLSTTMLREDMEYIYFEATTPGFSPFAIIGSSQQAEVTDLSSEANNISTSNSPSGSDEEKKQSESMGLPLLSNGILMIIFSCAYLVLRKRR